MAESSEDDADFASVESGEEEPELPSLEDRKAFLACLACILTSSYKYDAIDQAEAELAAMAIASLAKESGRTPVGSTTPPFGTPEKNSLRRGDSVTSEEDVMDIPGTANEVSMFLEEEEEEAQAIGNVRNMEATSELEQQQEEEGEDPNDNSKKGDTNQSNSNDNNTTGNADTNTNSSVPTTPRRRWRPRFRRGSQNESPGNGTSQEKDASTLTMSTTSAAGSTGDLDSLTNSGRKRIDQKQQRKRLSRAQKKLRLASQRHYNRRFIVADQLLQASCDHLLLDKELSESVYEELKPQLEALKSPRIIPPAGNPAASAIISADDANNNNNSDDDDANSNKNNDHSGSGSSSDDDAGKSKRESDREARERQMRQQYLKQHEWMTEYDEQLADHLPKLSAGAGYRCVCWLLFQHLLNASKRGYDSRVRFAFKSLAVAVLVQDIERTLSYDDNSDYNAWKAKNYTTWVSFATRKFEQVEAAMADRLLKLAEQSGGENNPYEDEAAQQVSLEELDDLQDDVQVVTVSKNKKKLAGAKKHLVRGLKIGGVGVVAGTLLAVTGGMAAPAIAGALTFLGMGAVAGTFLTLASTSAVVHLFGVAGGSLAAYKMRRRTAGLTEFTIVQSLTTASRQTDDPTESTTNDDLLPGEQPQQQNKNKPRLARWREKAKAFKDRRTNQSNAKDPNAIPTNVELSRTICISGWLTDKCDFQRPWGLTPTTPAPEKLEKLQRFYRIYNPDLIPVCNNLLKRWKKEMSTFWDLLEDKYGCNPDTLFPLKFGPMHDATLTEVEILLLDKLIMEIGEARGKRKEAENADLPIHVQGAIASKPTNRVDTSAPEGGTIVPVNDSGGGEMEDPEGTEQKEDDGDSRFQRQCYASVFEQVAPSSSLDKLIPPAHLATVWDFSSRYGGEVYTLHWESQMLLKLCLCFRDVALSATASAGQQAIRFMVANTLYLAASVPIYLVQAMNSIDETWSLVVSRAEEAGKELARSLLINEAGHRPVTLVAYSFGARVVFSCLKQLAVYQQQWEEYHEQKNSRAIGFAQHDEEGKSPNRKEKKWMLHELEFEREPASVVEDVILMGAPMYLSLSSWKACRQVVAGRFVNVYSRTDRILSLMFKYKQMMESFKPVCGNCTVAVPGVENIDISDLVSNHQEYVLKVGDILKRVRHGQPLRSSTNALDEIALIEEASVLALQQEKEAAEAASEKGES